MNATPNLERDLARWMAEVVPSRAPDHVASQIVAQTASVPPRPAWLARLKEPPMNAQLTFGRALGFGRSLRPILVAIVILSLLVGALYVGSEFVKRSALPPPFGVAGNGVIVADVSGELVVSDVDGTAVRTLDLPYNAVTSPVFSRDGARFAAWATTDPLEQTQQSIIVANADGSGAFEVVPDRFAPGPVGVFAWSPDDKVLAFSDEADRVYLVDVAGRSVAEFAPSSAITQRRDPAWAPDGRLAYRCQEGSPTLHLCVTNPERTTERILETSPGTEWAFQHSAWSHDGTRIAYYIDEISAAGPPLGFDMATIDVATGVEQVLTVGTPHHEIIPTWTPDDRYIVAIGAIIAADGSGVRLMNDGNCTWSEPSPDGRWATCLTAGQLQLYPIDGGAPTVIKLDSGVPGRLTWQRVPVAN